ncbi:hypothetical protein [Streptomyces incanus]|uniref:Uncharacterized protein n=1 Tax=Streptomyces incanus TaxID=887453 RepID=A0ABW0XF60_9ACTN
MLSTRAPARSAAGLGGRAEAGRILVPVDASRVMLRARRGTCV